MRQFFLKLLLWGVLGWLFFCAPEAQAAPPGYQEIARTSSLRFFTLGERPGQVEYFISRAESLFAPVARASGYQPQEPAEVIITMDHAEFRGLGLPAWAVGVARPYENQIILTLRDKRGFPVDLASVFQHEVSHLALLRAVGQERSEALPRWFIEGVAIWQAGEGGLARSEELLAAARSDSLIPLRDLDESFPSDDTLIGRAYAQSAGFVRFLAQAGGEDALAQVVLRVSRGDPFGVAVREEVGQSLGELEATFLTRLRMEANWLPVLTSSGLLWGLCTLLFLWGYVKRRRERKLRLHALAREEELLWEEWTPYKPPDPPDDPEEAAPFGYGDGSRLLH